MSLKARIEAVIYAAEEPVTLPQLAAIFRDEAVAARAARLTADAASGTAAAEAVIASEPGLAEAALLSEQASAEPAETESLEPDVPPIGALPAEGPAAAEEASEPAAQNSADAEVATPDFAGEPQPDPQPTPSGPDEALNAEAPNPEAPNPEAEPASESAPESESEPTPAEERAALDDRAALEERAAPEDEKKAARQRDREIREEIRRLVDELIADYASSDSGLEIREVAGGFRMATRAEYHDAVRAFVKSLKPPMKLSLQALETLAVIAYKQPITAPEIADVRGVDSGGVLGSLVARKLITTAGRKQVIGRPILYKTTREFLLRFGLRDLNELPSIEEFEKMASELAEPDDQSPAPSEELPFAQNEIAALEEASEAADQEEAEPDVADQEKPESVPPEPDSAAPEHDHSSPEQSAPPADAGETAQPEDEPADGPAPSEHKSE